MEDSLATLRAFRAMGVRIDGPELGTVTIQGVGMGGLQAPHAPLDLGNSGTSMRLMSGLLAGQGFCVTLTGDASLSSRPMKRVIDPLAGMGAEVRTRCRVQRVRRLQDEVEAEVEGGERLRFDAAKIAEACAGLRSLIALPDPVGATQSATQLDDRLTLYRVSRPIGVIGVIFESRPDALVQSSAVCLKSGNAVLLINQVVE